VILNNPRSRRMLGYYDHYHRKRAGEVNRGFLAWLDGHRDRPFFAFLNYFDAHFPYLPPEPFDGKFGPSRRGKFPNRLPGPAMLGAGFRMRPEEVQVELDAYDGAIAYMDDEIGRLFADLRQRGVLDNTLVIITSDHGEQFGEGGHRLFSHANSLYMSLLHVPLVLWFPGHLPAGKTVADAVSLRDVPSTVSGLVSLDSPPAFPGRSLTRFWDDAAAAGKPPAEPQLSEVDGRQAGNCSCQDPNCGPLLAEVNPCLTLPFPAWYPSSHGPMQSLVEGRLHYIRNGGGREELYDYKKDPFEEHNLTEAPDRRAALERFRTCLRVILP
jgi:arylsulfatase A-like enzyme